MKKITEDILREHAVHVLMNDVRRVTQGRLSSLSPNERGNLICTLLAIQQLLSIPFELEVAEQSRHARSVSIETLLTILGAPTIEEWEKKRTADGLQ